MSLATVESLIPIHAKGKQYALTLAERRFINLATVESLIPIRPKEKEKQYALALFEEVYKSRVCRIPNTYSSQGKAVRASPV